MRINNMNIIPSPRWGGGWGEGVRPLVTPSSAERPHLDPHGRRLAAVAALAMLSACTPYDMGLGENVKRNMAAQIIDPDPKYAGVPMEGSSGDHAAAATERYRKGTVKQPETMRTTSGSSGGGSGSGVSSGSSGSR